MKTPAAAFLVMALLAPRPASASIEPPKDPVVTEAPQSGNTEQPKEAAYGSFALDASGNKITGEALAKLPPEVQWAMKEKGLSPVLGPNNEVLGYDDGKSCLLPDGVLKDYGAAMAAGAATGLGVTGGIGGALAGAAIAGGMKAWEAYKASGKDDQNLPPPGTPASANVADMMATLGLKDGQLPPPNTPADGQDFCSANPGRPPCAAVKEPTPADIAENDLNKANDDIAKGSQSGDVEATAAAIDAQRDAQARKNLASKDPLGTKGTGDASTGPGPGTIASTGGQNMGPEGRVGGTKGGGRGAGDVGDGVEVAPDSRALAQSLVDMNKGMANGPLDGPSDPNVQSVAQVAQRGLGGRALDAARSLFGSLTENLGAQADAPETDLTDQLATSPIDGATANRAAIKVVECRRDTLDGTAGGRSSRRVGGC